MEELFGKVVEVFIPKQYKNDLLLDVMDTSKIGFKIMIDDNIEDFIFEQDEFNADIMKDDFVIIRKQTVDGHKFIDIEKYLGDDYE